MNGVRNFASSVGAGTAVGGVTGLAVTGDVWVALLIAVASTVVTWLTKHFLETP